MIRKIQWNQLSWIVLPMRAEIGGIKEAGLLPTVLWPVLPLVAVLRRSA